MCRPPVLLESKDSSRIVIPISGSDEFISSRWSLVVVAIRVGDVSVLVADESLRVAKEQRFAKPRCDPVHQSLEFPWWVNLVLRTGTLVYAF